METTQEQEAKASPTPSPQPQQLSSPHPMVSVPDALRVVLRETARCWMIEQQRNHEQHHTKNDDDTIPKTSLSLSLQELVGQRLAKNVLMPAPGYPAYNASIMDGYCIRTSDCPTSNDKNRRFRVVDKVYAGDDDSNKKARENTNSEGTRKSSSNSSSSSDLPTAWYITTGAVVPDGYDCVVPIEECQVENGQEKNTIIITISSTATIAPGKWIRQTGCDIAPGSVVLPKHHVLDAISIGLLYQVLGSSAAASSTESTISIQPRVRVGVLSTGNEIYDVVSSNDITINDKGKIPDVNRPILLSLLQQEPWKDYCQGIDLGMVRDDNIEQVTTRLREALTTCDVVITTGGVSMGETDIVEHVLCERLGGKLHFGRLHMKPGKPTTFVTFANNKLSGMVFAMPGNPVSATVCTHLLVQPAVRFLYYGPDESADTHGDSVDAWLDRMVENATVHVEVQARLTQDLVLDVQRPEYHRVRLEYDNNQDHTTKRVTATSTGVQRSSRLMSLLNADGLAVLPQGTKNQKTNSSGKAIAAAGDVYTVLLLRNPYGVPASTVSTSLHLNPQTSTSTTTKPVLRVGIVQLEPHDGGASKSTSMTMNGTDKITLSDTVQKALSGSKSGSVLVVSCQAYNEEHPNGLYDFLQSQKGDSTVDLIVIIGPNQKETASSSCFLYHTSAANALRERLSKNADALAMQAKRGAAAQEPKAALYETVVGYLDDESSSSSSSSSNNGVLVIFLPALGVEGALSNVRGLLKHALQIARGGSGHHQQHQSRGHQHSHGH